MIDYFIFNHCRKERVFTILIEKTTKVRSLNINIQIHFKHNRAPARFFTQLRQDLGDKFPDVEFVEMVPTTNHYTITYRTLLKTSYTKWNLPNSSSNIKDRHKAMATVMLAANFDSSKMPFVKILYRNSNIYQCWVGTLLYSNSRRHQPKEEMLCLFEKSVKILWTSIIARLILKVNVASHTNHCITITVRYWIFGWTS